LTKLELQLDALIVLIDKIYDKFEAIVFLLASLTSWLIVKAYIDIALVRTITNSAF